MKHPMQPVILVDGVIRFKENKIVRFLLDSSTNRGFGLNEIAMAPFSDEDREQLAQLIGYSVSGFGDLSYASVGAVAKADKLASELLDHLHSPDTK